VEINRNGVSDKKLKWRRSQEKKIRLIVRSVVYFFEDTRSGELVVTALYLTFN